MKIWILVVFLLGFISSILNVILAYDTDLDATIAWSVSALWCANWFIMGMSK
jgi:hypothetical protein